MRVNPLYREHKQRPSSARARCYLERAVAYAPVCGMVLLLALACGPARARSPAELPAVLEVENNAANDMNIYVVQTSGARNRLGTSTAHTTQWFRIPSRLIFGATPLRFQADPIGGNRLPVTQEITVVPGDTVVWRIPFY